MSNSSITSPSSPSSFHTGVEVNSELAEPALSIESTDPTDNETLIEKDEEKENAKDESDTDRRKSKKIEHSNESSEAQSETDDTESTAIEESAGKGKNDNLEKRTDENKEQVTSKNETQISQDKNEQQADAGNAKIDEEEVAQNSKNEKAKQTESDDKTPKTKEEQNEEQDKAPGNKEDTAKQGLDVSESPSDKTQNQNKEPCGDPSNSDETSKQAAIISKDTDTDRNTEQKDEDAHKSPSGASDIPIEAKGEDKESVAGNEKSPDTNKPGVQDNISSDNTENEIPATSENQKDDTSSEAKASTDSDSISAEQEKGGNDSDPTVKIDGLAPDTETCTSDSNPQGGETKIMESETASASEKETEYPDGPPPPCAPSDDQKTLQEKDQNKDGSVKHEIQEGLGKFTCTIKCENDAAEEFFDEKSTKGENLKKQIKKLVSKWLNDSTAPKVCGQLGRDLAWRCRQTLATPQDIMINISLHYRVHRRRVNHFTIHNDEVSKDLRIESLESGSRTEAFRNLKEEIKKKIKKSKEATNHGILLGVMPKPKDSSKSKSKSTRNSSSQSNTEGISKTKHTSEPKSQPNAEAKSNSQTPKGQQPKTDDSSTSKSGSSSRSKSTEEARPRVQKSSKTAEKVYVRPKEKKR